MCGICGCGETEGGHEHHHDHAHEHRHKHEHVIAIEQDILARNDEFALLNKQYFQKKQLLALNIMSSPGSGKTTLLIKTILALNNTFPFSVIVGDQQTDYDAKRFLTTGISALQINTGKGCHLDAHGIGHAIEKLTLPEHSILFIENVGNLVCPSLFNLGEQYKIVILSVTEGEDKPLKYPHMFHAADVVILTKTDLLPYLNFDVEQCVRHIREINRKAVIFQVSSTTEQNLDDWYHWLKEHAPAKAV